MVTCATEDLFLLTCLEASLPRVQLPLAQPSHHTSSRKGT